MPAASRSERTSQLRRKIRSAETRRRNLFETLLELRDLFAGSLSTVFRTCGKQGCICTRGKRHGPYSFLSIQSAGRNDRYHLSAAEVRRLQPEIERYRRFLRLLQEPRAEDRQIEADLRRLQRLCESRSVRSFRTS